MPEFQFPGCIDCLFRQEKFSARSWVGVYRWREWRPGTRGPPSTRRSSSGPWTSARSAGRYLHQPGNNKVKIVVAIFFFLSFILCHFCLVYGEAGVRTYSQGQWPCREVSVVTLSLQDHWFSMFGSWRATHETE